MQFAPTTARCEKLSAKNVIKTKCRNEKLLWQWNVAKARNGYKRNHMCVMAICIMEKDIPGCFRRPPHTQQLSLFAGATSLPSSPYNYLIYYHQLQSFASFPGSDLHLMIFSFLSFFIIHDFFVSFRWGYKFSAFSWATLARILFFCCFSAFFFNLYGKKLLLSGLFLGKNMKKKENKNHLPGDVCALVSHEKVWKLWKSFRAHSIYYQNKRGRGRKMFLCVKSDVERLSWCCFLQFSQRDFSFFFFWGFEGMKREVSRGNRWRS